MKLLFIGDIVAEAGLELLESRLPALLREHEPTFVVANAENVGYQDGRGTLGLTPQAVERLLASGIDCLTGGNHSWDSPESEAAHQHERVLRPLNYGKTLAGKGSLVLGKGGFRLGVVNLVSRTALSQADDACEALDEQLEGWQDQTDAVLIDFHGESVTEKLATAFAYDGRVLALLGTHTHVPTLDTRVLPRGTAYVSDVGMTGPSGGLQGYQPDVAVSAIRKRWHRAHEPWKVATGDAELGAVLVTFSSNVARSILRLQ
jgi:metallophosphoesterase (TIGR00282 family)